MNDITAFAESETSHSDPAATSTPESAAPAGTMPAGGAPRERPWYASIRDPGVRNWVAAKGFPDPIAAAESSYHSEKLLGHHRAGRTVVLPREDSPPEEVRAYRAKLGVPDKPEGYALPVPQGKSDEFAKAASRWMHEAGVPAKTAQQLAGRWNQHIAQLERQSRESWAAESAAGVAAMQAEWGTSYEHNAEVARRAALHFLPGADGESRTKMMDKIERALGSADFLRFMAAVGKGLTEHKLVQSGEAGDGSNLSPEEARHRIATLRADRAWTAAYVNGDGAKQAEMSRLHRMAFPGN